MDQRPILPLANAHGFAQTIPGNNPAESSVSLPWIKLPRGGTWHFLTKTLLPSCHNLGILGTLALGTLVLLSGFQKAT